MGFLKLFSRPSASDAGLMRLASGSFTVDRNGTVNGSTLPQSFPAHLLKDISEAVLATFRDARAAKLPLSELVVEFAAMKLTARELRGGAIVFLSPKPLSPK
jgi:hypothetical protein